MTTKATFTPWRAVGGVHGIIRDDATNVVCTCPRPETMAHIVACVNSHDALVNEVRRLRRVLQGIAASRPDAHMDIEKTPELTAWICDACHTASVGAYPPDGNADNA